MGQNAVLTRFAGLLHLPTKMFHLFTVHSFHLICRILLDVVKWSRMKVKVRKCSQLSPDLPAGRMLLLKIFPTIKIGKVVQRFSLGPSYGWADSISWKGLTDCVRGHIQFSTDNAWVWWPFIGLVPFKGLGAHQWWVWWIFKKPCKTETGPSLGFFY